MSGEGEEEQRRTGREGRWTVQAVQTGADTHVVPSARKKKMKMGRRETNSREKREGKGAEGKRGKREEGRCGPPCKLFD